MTKKELENLVAELQEQARLAKEPKPSTLRRVWNWCKPRILPVIFGVIVGVIVGVLFVNVITLTTPLENQKTVNLTLQERELVSSAIDIVERDIANGALQEEEAIDALMPLVPTPAKPLVQNSASLEDVKKKIRM